MVTTLARESSGASTRAELSISYLLYFGALGLFLPYFPLYMEARGLSLVQIGWLFAAGPLLRIIVPPLAGNLADNYRGPLFWCTVAAWGSLAGLLVVWFGAGPAFLVAGTLLYFLFTAPTIPLLDAATVQYLQRAKIDFGHIRLWGSVGFVFTSFGLGLLFPELPARIIIISILIFFSLFSMFLLFARGEPAQVNPMEWSRLPALLRNRVLWLLLAVTFLNRVASAPFNAFYAIFVRESGMGGNIVAWTWGIGVVTEVFVMLFVDRLIGRFSAAGVLATGCAIEALRWTAYSYVSSPVALLCLAPLHGTAFAFIYISTVRSVAWVLPSRVRSLGQGLATAAAGLGQTVGSIVGGYLHDMTGNSGMFLAAGLTGAAAVLASAIFARAYAVKSLQEQPG
jgi:MFS transporter, PPP family, 3-phenylpropionic acid transporter